MTDTLIEIDELNSKRVAVQVACGIYFLLRRRIVVYVGQSTCILFRVAMHVFEGEKEFDSYAFVECQKELLKITEDLYIEKYKPIYNFRHMPKSLKRARARARQQELDRIERSINPLKLPPSSYPPLWSVKECSEKTGVPMSTLQRWRSGCTGPRYIKTGGRILYGSKDAKEWLAANWRRRDAARE